ncbi:MAG: hypothetical protein A2521_11745 [Deltaproteobacteria bacterium RIFOXYD12_FULL_57_12]|nr:MAG: hypothetical protein A2521_11745 [Deltaproteobacteria bacterium RIFOXYD12_FULL_57_12]
MTLIILAAPLFGTSRPLAAENPLQAGKSYFDQGKFDLAHEALLEAFKSDPGNLDISFYLGRAAFEKGDYEAAVMTFDRILIMNPDASRVKLELARSYLKLGATDTARQYFQEVLATDPPAAVRANVEKYLATIQTLTKKHYFSGLVALGYDFNDNVRSAPISETVKTVIGDVTLVGPTSTPQHDQIFSTTVALNHVYSDQDRSRSWKTSGMVYNALYGKQHDLDVSFFNLSTGPAWRSESFLLELYGTASYLNLDDDRYLGSIGAGATATFVIDPRLSVSVQLQLSDNNYFQDANRDAFTTTVAAGPVLTLDKNRLSATISLTDENATHDVYSFLRTGAGLRYDRQLTADLALFASGRYRETNYEGVEALFDKDRLDKIWDMGVGITKVMWRSATQQRQLSVQLSHTYTDANSTIDLYTYEKNVTATLLQFAF